MDVPVDQAVFVNVRNCGGDLTEDQQEASGGELGLAELLPKKDVLRAVSLQNNRRRLVHAVQFEIRLVNIKDIWVGGQVSKLFCHVVGH